jgi:transposase
MRNSPYFVGTIYNYGFYDDSYRRMVAELAIELGSMKQAATQTGVSVGSVWRWLKAFDLARKFNMKAKRGNRFAQSPFTHVNKYSDQFRLTVVRYAMTYGTGKAAKLYGVSRGSVDNWIKAWQANNAYLNR